MTSSAETLAFWRLPMLIGDGGEPPPETAAPAPLALPELSPDPGAPAPVVRSEGDLAWERGLAEGMERGEARAGERLAPVLETLRRVTERLDASRQQFERDRERNLEALALAVAHRLVQREVAADPTLVRDLVARALELMGGEPAIQVRLHPMDLEVLQPALEGLAAGIRPAAVQWTGDAGLERGSFTVEGPQRIVDGRADSALRALFERLGS